ncbi:MAG: type II toxin-antitoxin system VapB family antitoxin [Chloroflexota bacterium]
MALNIKNHDVERLLEEVVQLTGESKTEAVRKALEERRHRLSLRLVNGKDKRRFESFLEEEIWPQIPSELLGTELTKEEEEEILGYGELGV